MQEIVAHGQGALGIVSPVDHEKRFLAQKLKSARPVHRVKPVLHIALLELPALCAQDLHYLQHRGGVFELVFAEQRQGVALAFVGKGLAVQGIKLGFDFVKVRNMERNAQFVASLPHDLGHALRLLEEHRVTARLQNARLLESDLLDRVAQHHKSAVAVMISNTVG